MDQQMIGGMAEATRLTREGRVLEATALIQRTLGVPSPLVTGHDPITRRYRRCRLSGGRGPGNGRATGIGANGDGADHPLVGGGC
jgi:hypothetical protein